MTGPITGIIDLHCHSSASDGSLAPAELVRTAAQAGVRILALTDHDTLAGVPEAQAAAAVCDITLIPAVEISVRWQARTLHLVGLDVDPLAANLVQGLAQLQTQRRDRAVAIAAKLEKLGLRDALARVRARARGGQLTRTHFAQLLVEDGICTDLHRAFKQFLARGRPGYAAAEWVLMETAIEWIRDAGGHAVLAHPLLYRLGTGQRRRLLTAFGDAGGTAMEVCCGASREADVACAAAEASEFRLLGSVGSDFHNTEQRWLRLGRLAPLPRSVEPVWRHLRNTALH